MNGTNYVIYFYIVHMSNVTLGLEISVLNRLRILMYLCDMKCLGVVAKNDSCTHL